MKKGEQVGNIACFPKVGRRKGETMTYLMIVEVRKINGNDVKHVGNHMRVFKKKSEATSEIKRLKCSVKIYAPDRYEIWEMDVKKIHKEPF